MLSPANKKQPCPFPYPWADFFLALPRSIAQSAVFGVSYRKGRRPFLDRTELFSWGPRRVLCTGLALDQFDLDVWLFCLNLAKSSNSTSLSLTLRQVCRGLQIGQGKKEILRVKKSISRLFSATLEITSPKKGFLIFSLLQRNQAQQNNKDLINIGFAPDLLFAMRQPILVDVGRRQALRLPLAKKLHVLFSGQERQKKHEVLLDNLILITSQECIEKKAFNRKLRASMDELQHTGILESWAINKHKITYFIRDNS